jgi:hypothetical protein
MKHAGTRFFLKRRLTAKVGHAVLSFFVLCVLRCFFVAELKLFAG